jgi:hypothetical protein
MIFEAAGFGTLRNGETRRAFTVFSHLLPRGDSKMTRRDQELLQKQLWGVSSKSSPNGIMTLIIVAVFLVGMGIGDILSKTKLANTHYAALISYPNGQN